MPNRRRRTGGGVHREPAQPPQQQNQVRPSPSFFQNPSAFHLQQNPNFSSHLENFRQNTSNQPPVCRQFPDRNFAIPSNNENDDLQPPRRNTSFSNFPQLQGAVRNVTVEKLDRAAMIAHRDLLASKENISVWKVSQAALLMVKAESWESLGFQIQQVPSLKDLLATEGKVNSFIHCYVAVRRIVSLYDLEVAICKSEGIEHFEELELGPLTRHQLAVHYFSVPSDVMEAYRIRTEEIIAYLCEFLDTHKKKDHNVDTFLDFVAMKQSVASKEKLAVRIQNFGQYIKFIKASRLSERIILTNYLKKDETGTPNKAKRKIRRRLLSFALKQPLVDHFTLTPQLTMSPSERLVSSSSVMDDRENSDYDEHQDEEKLPNLDKLKTFPKNMGSGSLGSDHPLVNKSLRLFITTWKGRCQRYEAHELLDRMLEYYQNKKRARIKTLFTSEPLVGLLNVAVSSLKFGMWDGYESDKAFDPTDVDRKETFESSADYTSIDVKANEKDRNEHGFSAKDIVNRISGYFEDDFFSHRNPSRGNKFLFLRKLCKSENWLIEAYSVKEFESLGYGEYFMFLEKYIHLFPYALQKCLMGDMNEKFPLKAYLLPLQFGVLLSQAINSLSENESINLQQVSELLARQFPLVRFDLVKSDLQENLTDILREKRFKVNSNSLLFSAPLLGLHCMDDSFAQNEKNMEETCGFGISAASGEGSAMAITADATEIFLKAPMLVDLNLWSHWDLLFAPSLGSIVEWLLNEVNSKELLCLVTRDGKIIRVDHSATTDSFLEVLIQQSAFETALKLLSLFALYGGEQHIPLSLLKCHARQAFEINGKSMLNKVDPAMSAFILDCLSFLPIEICSFAADVLISGLQSFMKDVPLAILSECKQFQQRIMLHHVGISLGIVEWMNDYHSLSASATTGFSPGSSCLDFLNSELNTRSMNKQDVLNKHNAFSGEVLVSSEAHCADSAKVAVDDCAAISQLSKFPNNVNDDPVGVIESIRKEEFGLGKNLSDTENRMLEKQHARLGRALQCLSQELYSQDSHFLLELVQNADDNVYPESVEPTLMFILQEESIVVLNNEQGFQANNIRALCDVGNSTKKGHNAGYIGKKGIGFKSVFRVTDAPEIHSNGFHIKFDITQGQIGFVLPTIVPPFDIELYTRLASGVAYPINQNAWNTCIVLPFRSSFSEGFTMNNIVSMFSELHPSMLLFLHRLQCIKFRNMLDDSLIAMRKEVIGGGIIQVALGDDKMTWLVASQKLQTNVIHSDVQTTEISVAFTLQETDAGGFDPILIQQPVFAFLPLRAYGLKFILQGDFVLPSSREEVDGSCPWNQWLLSQFPDLFVSAEGSFCDLPCFRMCPGKAVTAFMSFIPLMGDAHGFFSSLPRMIISKLRTSNCMLLECKDIDWVPPCKVLRNWTEQSRTLLPDSLLHEHAGLGFLNKDIILSDSLAGALGIEEYGPKILLKVISSVCRSHNGIKSMGLSWLCSWLNAIFLMSSHSSLQTFPSFVTEPDLILKLKKVPFIPLSCGKYGSLDGQTIWLHSDAADGINGEFVLKSFPKLYAKLQTVSPNLLAAASSIENSFSDTSVLENVTRMLYKLGVQRLSAHEILKVHILPAISAAKNAIGQEELMIEYLSFAMLHLQSSCAACSHERSGIIRELHMNALISTNHGFKRSNEVPIHLTREFGNPVDADKLINGLNVKWLEIDSAYMQHPITKSLSGGKLKWRKFFQEIGVTDFVKIVQVEKTIADMSLVNMKDIMYCNDISLNSVARNWESEELLDLLSCLSSRNDGEKSKYMLEILDRLWDDYFSDKTTCYCVDSNGEHRPFKSSLVSNLQDVPWISSSIDNELHYPKDLFQDCMAVHSVLGINAPYAIPMVRNEKLLSDIGLRTQVTLDDALYVLRVWRKSKTSFKASVSQMSNFYTLLLKGMELSKKKIIDTLHSGPFIFVPHAYGCSKVEDVDGALLSLQEVYWHDNTCPADQIVHPECVPSMASRPLRKILSIFYPNLHDFFVAECGVDETPPLCSYLQILLQLSAVALPHQAAKKVFEVFLKWGDALESKSLSLEDVEYLKESLLKKEYSVLPTKQDKWVSLHASFGLICWCDDDNLGSEFKQVAGVDFLYFGDFTDEENKMIQAKVSTILRTLGVPTLSEMVTREPIYYGPADCNFISSLVNWILPYAQRYILNAYPDKYFQFKQSGFKNITHLKIVVVEKLFYRNVIGRSDIISKKRHECNCLLQDNILYCNQGSDPHSIFLEFSRLLFNGNPILEVANFLHMITTMAESGATKEQMEFFIVNNQKVPKLPAEESCWSLLSTSFSADTHAMLLENLLPKKAKELNSPMFKRKTGINSNWPPEDWKTAPGFSPANTLQLKKPASISQQITEGNAANENFEQTGTAPPVIADELNIEAGPTVSIPGEVLLGSEIAESQPTLSTDVVFGSFDLPTEQALLIGRLGEMVAFKYFLGEVGNVLVKWVNEGNETGLPYDIIIGSDEVSREYIEVKATKSEGKNWFHISMREWQFAIEKGERYSIAHVVLSDDDTGKVVVYKHPARLCQLGKMKLAVVVPKQH